MPKFKSPIDLDEGLAIGHRTRVLGDLHATIIKALTSKRDGMAKGAIRKVYKAVKTGIDVSR